MIGERTPKPAHLLTARNKVSVYLFSVAELSNEPGYVLPVLRSGWGSACRWNEFMDATNNRIVEHRAYAASPMRG